MSWLTELSRRVSALIHRRRMVRDLDDEMRLHVQLRQERLQQGSDAPDDARAEAIKRFGNMAQLREDAVGAWGWQWLEQVAQDARIGLRTLVRSPAFALTAVATLALGIGATTAVFSVVNGVVLRPLPLPEPDRLVQIYGTSPLTPLGGAVPNIAAYRRESQSFEAMAGCEFSARYLRAGAEPERIIAVQAERPFFAMLGVPPLRGRTFGPGDASKVAVITEPFWIDRFGGDPEILGKVIHLDDEPFTIVGVMPASFQFPYRGGSLLSGATGEARADMWIPMDLPDLPRVRVGRVTARLKPGVSLASAQSEMSAISAHLAESNPDVNKGSGIRLTPLHAAVVGASIRQPLFVLLGAVGLVLVLACANVANLSLVRVMLRGREVAVRSALGASRLRLVRQFLTESLLLSFMGGVVGLAIGWWGTRQLLNLVGAQIPRAHEVGFDWRVFVFVLTACTLSGIGVGLAPAILAGRRDAKSVLQESSGHSTMSPGPRRLRDGLAVAEVALAFVLAIGAALLIRELARLNRAESGMVTKNVVTFHVGHRMSPQTNVRDFYEIADRVSQLPGVRAAGFIQLLPLQNSGWGSNSSSFRVEGRPPQDPIYSVELRYVTPGYFEALGIPIRRGRGLTMKDDRQSTPVILINETLARKAFPGEDPVGLVTTRGTVVGIVGDVRQANLDRPALPEIYYPIAQNWSQLSEQGLTLLVSTAGAPESSISVIRAAIREVNPKYAVFRIKTMDRVVAESLSDFTLYLALIGLAAGLALVLAISGTYGVVSYIATSRMREFAIRVALGADRARVTRLVVFDGLRLTAVGLGLGLIGALSARGLLRDLPITVRPPDWITTTPLAVAIALVAVLACLLPARRAAAVDPLPALRSE